MIGKKTLNFNGNVYKKLTSRTLLKEQEKELWRVFSRFIRFRDKLTCYTCGKIHKKLSECDAGHFRTQGASGILAKFDPRNVHCQCTTCNKWKSGNLAIYAENLERDYGFGILQELAQVAKQVFKPTEQWYQDQIRYYSMKVEELQLQMKSLEFSQ